MNCIIRLIALAVALGFALGASPDVVTLTNGDRLSGTVGVLQEGVLTLATEMAGEVKIPWANVAGIETNGAVAVRGADGAVREGLLVVRDGSQFVKIGEALEPIMLEQVQAVGASADALAGATAPVEAEAEPDIWSGVIDLGATWRTGTRETVDARSTLTVVREKPKDKLTLLLDAAYGEDEDIPNKRSVKGEGKWQFFPRERFYYYGLLGAEHDDIRKLELRMNAAAGAGYVFIKNDTRTWSADAGLDYAHERWEIYNDDEKDARRNELRAGAFAQLDLALRSLGAGTLTPSFANLTSTAQAARLFLDTGVDNGIRTQNSVSLRLSTHYEQVLFEKGKVIDDLTLLPELDDVGELRLTNSLAFTTPLSEALSLKLALNSEYDSDPGENVSNWDHLFTTGLQLKF